MAKRPLTDEEIGEMYLRLARRHLKNGDTAEAERIIRDAPPHEPESPGPLIGHLLCALSGALVGAIAAGGGVWAWMHVPC